MGDLRWDGRQVRPRRRAVAHAARVMALSLVLLTSAVLVGVGGTEMAAAHPHGDPAGDAATVIEPQEATAPPAPRSSAAQSSASEDGLNAVSPAADWGAWGRLGVAATVIGSVILAAGAAGAFGPPPERARRREADGSPDRTTAPTDGDSANAQAGIATERPARTPRPAPVAEGAVPTAFGSEAAEPLNALRPGQTPLHLVRYGPPVSVLALHDVSSPRRRRAAAYAYGARDLEPKLRGARRGKPSPARPESMPERLQPPPPAARITERDMTATDAAKAELDTRRLDLADRIRRFSKTPAARRELRR